MRNRRKIFTMNELLIVIGIIGILAALLMLPGGAKVFGGVHPDHKPCLQVSRIDALPRHESEHLLVWWHPKSGMGNDEAG